MCTAAGAANSAHCCGIVGEGNCSVLSMAETVKEPALSSPLQVAKQQAAVLEAVSPKEAAQSVLLDASEELITEVSGGWEISVPLMLSGLAVRLMSTGNADVVPIEPDVSSEALGALIAVSAYNILTCAGNLLLDHKNRD